MKDVERLDINTITPHGWHGFPERRKCLLNEYHLDLSTDTSVLSFSSDLQNLFLEIINELYIQLNISPPRQDLIEAFLEQEGWLVKAPEDERA